MEANRSPGNIPSDLKRRPREGTWNYREYISSEDYSQAILDGPTKTDTKETMSRFQYLYIVGDKIDLVQLRRCMWDNGCHKNVRHTSWKMILGYLPNWTYLHESVLALRRQRYRDTIRSIPSLTAGDQEEEAQSNKQLIRSGLSNTALKIPLFRSSKLSKMLERIIQVWLMDNDEQPYVDTLARIPLPIIYAFLWEYGDPEHMEVDTDLSDEAVLQLEVDVYNCMSLLLKGDAQRLLNGNSSQMLSKLAQIVRAVDPALANHIEANVAYADFALQWIDTLLIDQLQKISLTAFLWDRYLASGSFVDYHLSVCAFILARFEAAIKKLKQQDLLQYLQSIPLHKWDYSNLEPLIDRLQETTAATGIVAPPPIDYVELKAKALKRVRLGLGGAQPRTIPAMRPSPAGTPSLSAPPSSSTSHQASNPTTTSASAPGSSFATSSLSSSPSSSSSSSHHNAESAHADRSPSSKRVESALQTSQARLGSSKGDVQSSH